LTRHVADLGRRRRELAGPDPDDPRKRADRLADELFRRHLRTIAVDRLEEYPGIGPGTVQRVLAAGRNTMADLTSFPFESIHGIGPGKANDLRTAVGAIVREARSRFDSGGCPEAEEYRKKLTQLNAETEGRAANRRHELAAVEEALRSAEPLLVGAGKVTFWNYLFHRVTAAPSDEMMGRSLPTVNPHVGSFEELFNLNPQTVASIRVEPIQSVLARQRGKVEPIVPLPPVPAASPAVARPAPQPAAFPPVAAPAATPPADLFHAEMYGGPGSGSAAADHPWLPKLVAVARFGFAVARADGRVAQAEKKVIRGFLAERFGHDAALARHIDPLMERTEAAVPAEAEAVAAVVSATTADERPALYWFAERIADASGPRNQREQDVLARVAAAFGVTTVATAPPPPPEPAIADDPKAVLEIDAGTPVTPDLVRRRYALLTDKLDPAKAAALGPEFARMAEEKRTQLRAAAEALLAGEPLEKAGPQTPADLRHNPDLDDVFGN
jgi:uncharacterized tellurite resistance protein B-like protein